MTGSFSDFMENELLDHLFGGGNRDYTSPTIYVALSTADPSDDGSGVAEPSGNNYAREATADTDWTVSSAGALENLNDIEFNQASGSWGTITHFALFDASTNGNMLAHGDLSASKAVGSGDTPKFSAGDLDVSLD